MKTQNQHIKELIAHQLDGTPLTDMERKELLAWLLTSEDNRLVFLEAYEEWGKTHLTETYFDTEHALENFMSRIADASPRHSRSQTRLLHAVTASVACILLAFVGYFWFQSKTVSDIETYVRQSETPVYTQKEVQLVLSEQRTLLLEKKQSTIRYDSLDIRINNAEKVIPKQETASFNQLIVPYGKQTTLTLSDGTRIWANAGSCLTYPVIFDSRKREIFVEGEVYMEVAHDANRPFAVHTGKMDVRVLGTKFYISSYGQDNTHEVVLLSGSVAVAAAGASEKEVRIVPDQQAKLSADGTLNIRQVKAEDYISWIYGYLHFNNDQLSSVLERLSRYYDCRIECTAETAALTLSGKLELKDTLDEVLRILTITAPICLHTDSEGRFLISDNKTAITNPN